MIFVATENGSTKQNFSPSFVVLLLDPGSRIQAEVGERSD